ncbi:hypothetical protein K435DRAFT_246391 [Dendrothele bispora CBS 962.96]|uniref:Uncharacterized protein n=1 Tax=Dendrothele bispora (strain CBS 962.96) TaxID=1314807 RepID=A0A4S8LP33_DENBC|nr:hypothetical protein K435DRAFT_246391 [Dendrothele bispora CBS 962.96]
MNLENSPFYHLLETNHAASRAETEHILEFLRLPEQELQNVNEEITRLDTLLNALRSRREKLVSYIHKHRQLLSPIRRLPAEIIAELFTFCLPATHPPTRDLSEPPLLLTLVCKQWREIALSTPCLWSALHIYIPHSRVSDENFLERRKNGIKQWLERSGNLPISLSLTHRCPSYDPDNQESLFQHYSKDSPLSSLMECLIEYSPRWKNLSLSVPDGALRLIGAVPPEKLGILQRLFVNTPNYPRSLPMRGLEKSFAALLVRLPRLTSLHIREHSMLQFQSGFQWSKLTELSVLPRDYTDYDSMLYFPDIMRLLSQTPGLRVCKVVIRLDRLNVSPAEYRVTLPLLRDLTLLFSNNYEPPLAWAQSLTTPSLAKLTISTVWGYDNIVATHPFFRELLLKLLGDSSTSMETLHIAITMPLPDLVCCLQLIPRLRSLIIGFVRHDKDQKRRSFIFPGRREVDLIGMLSGSSAIVVDNANAAAKSQSSSESLVLPLCPELQTLKFLGMKSPPTPSAFLNLIRSRREYSSLYSSQNSDPDSCKCCALRTLEVYCPWACNRDNASQRSWKRSSN